MLHKILLLLTVLTFILGFAVPALAQEPTAEPTEEPMPTFDWPPELPATAQEGLEIVKAFLVFVSALATIYITRWIRKLPLLTDKEKSKIVGVVADAVAGAVGAVTLIVLTYGAYVAGFLDSNGMWSVLRWIFAVWPTTWVMHKGLKISRAVGH